MAAERTQFRPGTPVRVTRQTATRAKLAIFGFPLHEHFGDVGHVTTVEDGPTSVRYEVRFDPYGDECLVFDETELEPAPPRKT
jgi:hypothetical protein